MKTGRGCSGPRKRIVSAPERRSPVAEIQKAGEAELWGAEGCPSGHRPEGVLSWGGWQQGPFGDQRPGAESESGRCASRVQLRGQSTPTAVSP